MQILRYARMLGIIVPLSLLAACSSGGTDSTAPQAKNVASVTVTPGTASLAIAASIQLSASTLDNSGSSLTGRAVVWSSSNAGVASVSSNGNVTAVAAGAPVTVTATSEGVHGSATITVIADVASVSITAPVLSFAGGTTTQLVATPRDAANGALTGRTVSWTTSNTAIASVSQSGLVLGVAPGSVAITAASEGKSGTVTLIVTPAAVASVAVSLAAASVTAGGSVLATAVVRDAAGTVLAGRTVTWASSNKVVATFDVAGTVSALGPGTTSISATSEGVSGNASLLVIGGAPGTAPVATAVGVLSGITVSGSIGPAGGTVTSVDGRLSVVVPANALAATVMISVQPMTNTAPGGMGAGYKLLPEGQTFTVPVRLSWHYGATELKGTSSTALAVAYQDAEGYWQALAVGTYDDATATLTVPVSHFSNWVTITGLSISPLNSVIHLNQTLNLSAQLCSRVSSGGSAQRLSGCVAGSVTTWAVNSVPNGNAASIGTVFGNSSGGIYTAPAQSPSSNPLSISATADAPLRTGDRSTVLVSARVAIIDKSWSGTSVYLAVEEPMSSSSNMKWLLNTVDNGLVSYSPTGTATFSWARCSLRPTTSSISATGYLFVDYNADPITYRGQGAHAWPITLTCLDETVAATAGAIYLGVSAGTGESRGSVAYGSGVPTIEGGLIPHYRFTAGN